MIRFTKCRIGSTVDLSLVKPKRCFGLGILNISLARIQGRSFWELIKLFPVRVVSVSVCSFIARYFDCSLSDSFFSFSSRADLTSSGKIWWSDLVAKWCAILLVSSLGLITLVWEDLLRIYLILRQIWGPPRPRIVCTNCKIGLV